MNPPMGHLPTKDAIFAIAWLSSIQGYLSAAFLWCLSHGQLNIFTREFSKSEDWIGLVLMTLVFAMPAYYSGVLIRNRGQRPLVVNAATSAIGSITAAGVILAILISH